MFSLFPAGSFMFLIKLAWDCRYRLPLLITVGFMVFDIRMQLDVNIQMRQVQRPRNSNRYGAQGRAPVENGGGNEDVADDVSENSWATFDETTDDEVGA